MFVSPRGRVTVACVHKSLPYVQSPKSKGGVDFTLGVPPLPPGHVGVFKELLSVDLFVFGNIEFVLTMLGLCCSLEVARTSGLQSPISC